MLMQYNIVDFSVNEYAVMHCAKIQIQLKQAFRETSLKKYYSPFRVNLFGVLCNLC